MNAIVDVFGPQQQQSHLLSIYVLACQQTDNVTWRNNVIGLTLIMPPKNSSERIHPLQAARCTDDLRKVTSSGRMMWAEKDSENWRA